MKYEFIYFDVADTLLYKDGLYEALQTSLAKFAYNFERKTILQKHKLVSELIPKPEKTTREFYNHFNSEFLNLIGIVPRKEIIDTIFKNCKNLKWKRFDDTNVIGRYRGKIGIISNWDRGLRQILNNMFDFEFKKIIISSEIGMVKPDWAIYRRALSEIKVEANHVLYIGNSFKFDIAPASKIGMKAVLIDRDNLYSNYSYMKIRSLREIGKLLDINTGLK